MTRTLPRPAVFLVALLLGAGARGQPTLPEPVSTRSVSGQFTVSGTAESLPLFRRSDLATNASFVRLEPALLAVTAERFKTFLWNQIGLKPDAPWQGKVFLTLRAARSADDGITIAAVPLLRTWNYRVELPDVLARTRCARALAAVLLLEIANRDSGASRRSAEIPAWLVAGFAQQALAAGGTDIILSSPSKKMNGLVPSRSENTEHRLDPLAAAHQTLQNSTTLTFGQLSWPDDAQVDGADGGVYLASAQLLVNNLLGLRNGAGKLRAMLAQLPGCLNWQTAFYSAFRENFHSPLDVEKWWALRVVAFAAHDPSPHWSAEVSRERLAGLLSVPVEFRSGSNALPAHAEIPLQAALRNFTREQQASVLPTKLRDLELAQFRLAPPFATLAGNYRNVLADFLGEKNKPSPVSVGSKHGPAIRHRASLEDTLNKLDALDRRRREMEAQLESKALPPILNRALP